MTTTTKGLAMDEGNSIPVEIGILAAATLVVIATTKTIRFGWTKARDLQISRKSSEESA
jgi:hypothetical protein